MCLGTYIGYVFEQDLDGTDGIVEEAAASTKGLEANVIIPSVEAYGDMGEYVGFTLAGIIAGFIFGYFWVDIRGETNA